MKTPRPGTGPDVGEGSGLSSASLVPPASPRNGHSRGGTGFHHGLACCQFGLIIIKRGTQGEERVSGDGRRVQVMLPGDEAGGQESGWEEV